MVGRWPQSNSMTTALTTNLTVRKRTKGVKTKEMKKGEDSTVRQSHNLTN